MRTYVCTGEKIIPFIYDECVVSRRNRRIELQYFVFSLRLLILPWQTWSQQIFKKGKNGWLWLVGEWGWGFFGIWDFFKIYFSSELLFWLIWLFTGHWSAVRTVPVFQFRLSLFLSECRYAGNYLWIKIISLHFGVF